MPQIGEVKRGREIGRNSGHHYVWATCLDCGKERWIKLIRGKPESLSCRNCADEKKRKWRGNANPHWRGGRIGTSTGYIQILLKPDDFFYPMTNHLGYVREHRLIMARHLNRCLLPWEIVHHRNGIRNDNRIENLKLLPSGVYHISDTHLKNRVSKLEKQVSEQANRIINLEADNILLRQELRKWQSDALV